MNFFSKYSSWKRRGPTSIKRSERNIKFLKLDLSRSENGIKSFGYCSTRSDQCNVFLKNVINIDSLYILLLKHIASILLAYCYYRTIYKLSIITYCLHIAIIAQYINNLYLFQYSKMYCSHHHEFVSYQTAIIELYKICLYLFHYPKIQCTHHCELDCVIHSNEYIIVIYTAPDWFNVFFNHWYILSSVAENKQDVSPLVYQNRRAGSQYVGKYCNILTKPIIFGIFNTFPIFLCRIPILFNNNPMFSYPPILSVILYLV